ncbi:MAG TPA: hypothetical protein VNC21_00440 [Vicinamibacterales bacterium]|nr:hypothetical protein [Vicinamibacterales bacterium]
MTFRRAVTCLALLLVSSLALVIALSAGPAGLGYAFLYGLALVPGLPIGFRLFGSRHAAGWIVGAAAGYLLTTLGLWLTIAVRAPHAVTFLGAWVATAAIAWGLTRGDGPPLIAAPAWTSRDTAVLLLVLLLVPAIAGPPFIKLGARDAEGNRYYRAYFSADFVWHMAVTAEVKKFAMPPRNMFMPHRPLHYYWGYFLLPAAVSGTGPRALTGIEGNLKVNAIGTATLLVASMFIMAWLAVPRAFAVAGAVTLTIVASSFEGAYEIVRLMRRGAPLSALRDINIDAVSNWQFGGLRVDGIPRCFWWVPQHSMAYILGLAALAIANAAGSAAPLSVHALTGLSLAGAIAFNPFVGALFALAWGLGIAFDAVRSPDPLRRLVRCAVATVPAGAALVWCVANQMTGGASGMLRFGLVGNARHAPLFNLFLSLGPTLIPAAIGLATAWRLRRTRALAAPIALIAVSLVVMHFVVLASDDSWIGFRTGHLILLAASPLIAASLAAPGGWRRIALAVAMIAFLAGLPTTIVDVYNAQDITNRADGPGFPWTQVVDAKQDEALTWVRKSTATEATVQLDAVARKKTTWSIIPSFGERRMAAGEPRTLVDDPEYHERSERVRRMYATGDAQEAWNLAHELRIDYVWIDEVERTAYPAGMAKFETAPQYFAPAFKNDRVTIFRVQ